MEEARTGPMNVISQRIAEMLRKYPPFSMFEGEEVMELARRVQVKVIVKGEELWTQGSPSKGEIYFLNKGRIEYYWDNDGQDDLVDIRDVGDVLGLSAVLEKESFLTSARVAEDAILYVIPVDLFLRILNRHDPARYYVRRHLFWSTRVGARISMPAKGKSAGGDFLSRAHFDSTKVIRTRNINRLLTCFPDESLFHVAKLMSSKRVPSIVVVDEQRHPLGVVTNSDLIKYCIVGKTNLRTRVEKVMASPVYAVAEGSNAMAAMLLMLRKRIGQICVTEDGTVDSPLLDIFTHKDFLVQSGHHPAGMINEIRAARTTARLRELCDDFEELARAYLEPGLSAIFVAHVFAELHDELVIRLMDFAVAELDEEGIRLPEVEWAWMAVGSDGRREQILRTDMDNAFIFKASGDPKEDDAHRSVFLQLTRKIVDKLVECGFSRCQGGVMASNPRWCRTEKEWLAEFSHDELMVSDHLLRLITMFDLRPVTGSSQLAEELRAKLFDLFQKTPLLQRRMAEMAVQTPPPLNFWGNFVVARKGSAEGQFDIKSRGLNPLRDGVLLLALKYRFLSVYSTDGRLRELQRAAPRQADMAVMVQQSYDFMFRLRVLNGLERGDSGRYIEPGKLDKVQRTLLTNAFDVQRILQRALRTEFSIERVGT